jgi:quercetin 2,3-dioxygenase
MRKIEKIYRMHEGVEGAGVHLKRGFSYAEAKAFDPFLLFDDFSNAEANAYRAGFPFHPHRGMETVTYLLQGEVAHRDSMGNEGNITAGDVQWMTAGSGIVHEEMPVVHEGGIRGFQLWVNLPAKDKMMAPRYQDIKATEIPVVESAEAAVRVIAGEYAGVRGPVQDLMASPTYLDVTLNARMQTTFSTLAEDNFFAYVIEGRLGVRDDRSEDWVGEGEIVLLTHDTKLMCTGGKDGTRFLLIGGKPLKEPIVWHGPIVMNTDEEIKQALADMRDGTFVK